MLVFDAFHNTYRILALKDGIGKDAWRCYFATGYHYLPLELFNLLKDRLTLHCFIIQARGMKSEIEFGDNELVYNECKRVVQSFDVGDKEDTGVYAMIAYFEEHGYCLSEVPKEILQCYKEYIDPDYVPTSMVESSTNTMACNYDHESEVQVIITSSTPESS